jgi:hypothetical protein
MVPTLFWHLTRESFIPGPKDPSFYEIKVTTVNPNSVRFHYAALLVSCRFLCQPKLYIVLKPQWICIREKTL